MPCTPRLQSLADHARQAMYAVALVVGLSSLWTVAYAHSLEARVQVMRYDRDPGSAAATDGGGDLQDADAADADDGDSP